VRALLLFACGLALLTLAGFGFPATELAVPAALAGASSIVIGIG
jgi:hypothetical protein